MTRVDDVVDEVSGIEVSTRLEEASNMTVSKEEAYRLFETGKRPRDLIEMGVPRSTAYSWHDTWLENKGKMESKSEGEKTALLFNLFKQGKSMVDVVIETKLPYDDVREALERYEEAAEVVILRLNESTRMVNKLNAVGETADRFSKTLTDLEAEAHELEEKFAALDNLMQKRHPALVLLALMKTVKCDACGGEGLKLPIICPHCHNKRMWG